MLTVLSYHITAIVCLSTAFVIQRVYSKERQKDPSSLSVSGIKWFALAIFSWGIGALINIVFITFFNMDYDHKLIISLGVLISLVNSLFILMSIPSIEHNQERNLVIRIIERFTSKEVFIIFGGILAMIASVFFFSYSTSDQQDANNNVIWLIDIPISLLVAFALLQELNKAFKNRGMQFMYLPTFALFVLIIIAVTHRLIPIDQAAIWMPIDRWNLLGVVTGLSFKFLFILLFTILLYSWKLLAEKEEQQFQFIELREINTQLNKEQESLIIANESHLDTIKRLKSEISDQKIQYEQLKKDQTVNLSERQKEVLGNLGVCGIQKSYTEIAEAMNISVDGFQTHIYQIKKVLNISGTGGKEQLIQYATSNNLLSYATISLD
jgi:DNA-binding CsgD family transcriptional regulator